MKQFILNYKQRFRRDEIVFRLNEMTFVWDRNKFTISLKFLVVIINMSLFGFRLR